ncbi:hypothetical protein SNOG_10445 [Parastagonospora nodorum SN15]|uniref:Uncharacterized protein n=1 Tax=Phaeosphaeria nodorum (strain SN15 / ATCC MYA-4574 / FGSC 10173) TaxID=321614 RepID=Q0UCR9_PHANO|nr:hypothetical protein SNOG_10445 [Parastagonospora nodorum SN15]EAT81839.1 hypothetical protein SNOG_10445 [Parastagonospora nodorum SN15]
MGLVGQMKPVARQIPSADTRGGAGSDVLAGYPGRVARPGPPRRYNINVIFNRGVEKNAKKLFRNALHRTKDLSSQ